MSRLAKEQVHENQTPSSPVQAISVTHKKSDIAQFQDLREETAEQRKLQNIIQSSDVHSNITQIQSMVSRHDHATKISQLKNITQNSPNVLTQLKISQLASIKLNDEPRLEYEADVMGAKVEDQGNKIATQHLKEGDNKASANLKGNDKLTGFPHLLKAGFATMGHEINPTVHYNSGNPAQFNAFAYAQGNDIYLGPGQERHLPHEAWHVLQQKQGRVTSNRQLYESANPSLISSLNQSNSYSPENLKAYLESSSYSQDGIVYTTMSDTAYNDWQQTIQCKVGLHGACSVGGQTTVTQFENPSAVMQMVGLSKKAKAILLIIEGALTAAAGIGAIAITGGVGIGPGILAILIGVSKIVRAILMFHEETEDKPSHTKLIDILRGLEAGMSVAAAAITGNPAIWVFGIAKLIRSLATLIVNYEGDKAYIKIMKKAAERTAVLAHMVEVVALGFAGVGQVSESAVGAAAVLVTTASKGIRTADQTSKAMTTETAEPTLEVTTTEDQAADTTGPTLDELIATGQAPPKLSTVWGL